MALMQSLTGNAGPLQMREETAPASGRTLADALRSTSRLAQALNVAQEALIVVDVDARCVEINRAARSLLGIDGANLIGEVLPSNLGGSMGIPEALLADRVRRCIEGKTRITHLAQPSHLRSTSPRGPINLAIEPLTDTSGVLLGAALSIQVPGERQASDYAVTHDPLTGLPNRFEFERQLQDAFDECQRLDQQHVLCYLDLDHFKLINETQGHEIGDAYLRDLAALLQTKVRRSDTICRVGGDEFAIIFKGCDTAQGLRLAQSVLFAVESFRWLVNGRELSVGASIGAVTIDTSSPGVSDLMARVDSARQIAKEEGRHRIYHCGRADPHLSQRFERMRVANDLRSALDQGRFCLYAEPVCSTETPQTTAYHELLLRMVDPNGGVLMPGQFIPAAEHFMLMPPIDHWVLNHTFRNLQAFEGRVAINLSGQSLNDPQLAQVIEQLMTSLDVDPHRLVIELTETAAIRHLAVAEKFMRRLASHGIEFALDDFGSGLSSFAYLHRLPVQWLKIDGLFLSAPNLGSRDRALISAMAKMAHDLGIRSIAEHVEYPEQRALLRDLGVGYVQGYIVGKAVAWPPSH